MKSIREQIEDKCIHFNGIEIGAKCKAGIAYSDVRDTSSRPYKIPCLKNSVFSGSHCDKVQFPDEQEVDRKLKLIDDLLSDTFI